MPPFDTLLLCAGPRSGSTLLCRLLAATGTAGKPESFFRREDREDYVDGWQLPRDPEGRHAFADYLAAVQTEGRTPNGILAIRLMAATLPELLEDLAALWPDLSESERLAKAFGRIRIVHLSRADHVAQAVSRLKAEQTGLWHRAVTWEERHTPTAPLTYDHDRIAAFVAELQAGARVWEDFFVRTGLAPIRIDYEALAADPSGSLLQLMQSLDLPRPDPVPRAETFRLTDETNADWITRFKAEARST